MKRSASQALSASSSSTTATATPTPTTSTSSKQQQRRQQQQPTKKRLINGPPLEGIIDTTSPNTKLWLVKVPSFIFQEWSQKKTGDLLGTLKISEPQQPPPPPPQQQQQNRQRPLPPPTITFSLNGSSGSGSGSNDAQQQQQQQSSADVVTGQFNSVTAPHLYAMKIDVQQQAAYSTVRKMEKQKRLQQRMQALKSQQQQQAQENGAADESQENEIDEKTKQRILSQPCITVHGVIDQMFNMIPKMDAKRMEYLRRVTEEANKRDKCVKVDMSEASKPRGLSALRQAVPILVDDVARKDRTKDKRVKKPKEELMEEIWKLFEEQPYWGLKELADKTEQPQNYLKDEILADICVYHRRDEHKGTYSLKVKSGVAEEAAEQQKREAEDWE